MRIEEKLAEEVRRSGFSVSFVSKLAGIPYVDLYKSLNGIRQMTGRELILVCTALHIDPIQISQEKEIESEKTSIYNQGVSVP